jgi:RimK family alpha-L-glutamate ligase
MQKIYLVNNKKKELDFKKTFQTVANNSGLDFENASILDFAFSYSRTNDTTSVYYKKHLINPSEIHWFIRAWAPSEDATALLSIILELKKIPFTDSKINSQHEIRTSKLSQTFQLTNAKCSCPSTWVIPLESFSKYKTQATKDLKFPVIVKARGGLGKRVWKCETGKELDDTIKQLKSENKDDLIILQENIENEGDIRVVVFKNEVIASIERKSTTGFLNNVSQGGIATATSITDKEKKLAIKAAKAIGLDLAGVDLVRTKSETLIFEVNKAPDITSFHKATKFNIAEKIIQKFVADLKTK